MSIITTACDRQLSESRQKVSSVTEQLERKVAANSADSNTHGSENGPTDTSVLKVRGLPAYIALNETVVGQKSRGNVKCAI